ncbi:MAG: ParB N-terminal domain-containing protein [Gemmatimonadales bacterium]|nr:ParB N-terminal domain-containing protein [Gemmatimonadales bacterium]NIN12974.1 ParB N-terminal domain-containing protein [Gemmatimonadales bacterium]NIN51051.1 ParB N-terminal domain-containing protein [Gemmatimonadales bacterium]NIP08515.1 ParB N-terminal domain-containing protein [Gemmatimonadales bacterium]NIR02233.1 ParB N-terminal domain-containing protein [Gemmatimonadales bacterium]
MPKAAGNSGKKAQATSSKRTSRKKKQVPPHSRGLAASRLASASPPATVTRLAEAIEQDGGVALVTYRDPLGGNWQILAGLPIDAVEATPFQRDLSEPHVTRLAAAIEKLDRYLDPVIAVRVEGGKYWTPNGHHRLAAVHRLGGRSIAALVVPEQEVARRILILNTEKAHNLRERALEVIRLAQGLAELDDRPEREFAIEFEEPALLTLGLCYQERGRYSGGAYHSVLKRVEKFLASRLSEALDTRRQRSARLLELDDVVIAAVNDLKDQGFKSPYLKAFVVARINPLRFKRGAKAEFDETIDKMLQAARRFDAAKVRVDQIAGAGGPPEE